MQTRRVTRTCATYNSEKQKYYLGIQVKAEVQLRSSAPIAGTTEPGVVPATKKLVRQENGASEKSGSGSLP